MAAYLVENVRDAQVFIDDKDIHEEKGKELNISRDKGKTINHGLTYGMGKLLLASSLKVDIYEASNLINAFWNKNPELYQFNNDLKVASEIETPLFKRKLKLAGRTKLNWVIQGSCAELLWKALIYLFKE